MHEAILNFNALESLDVFCRTPIWKHANVDELATVVFVNIGSKLH